jgi:hypothetical protein
MCDKRVELDKKIEHYERIAAAITDQFTIDRIKMLIEELRVRTASLHPKAASMGPIHLQRGTETPSPRFRVRNSEISETPRFWDGVAARPGKRTAMDRYGRKSNA